MRINVYAEEITDRVEVVETTADTGARFIGIRFYLKTHPSMVPPLHPDDDSSGVTFWVKSGKGGYRAGQEKALVSLLRRAADALAPEPTDGQGAGEGK